jgi:putative pyruvate formate lyase activating enzyme
MPVVSSTGPHYGEEQCLVGAGGSGTIFMAGCNLGCDFCQNFGISHHRSGEPQSIEQLAQFMLDMQEFGCSNVNIVTPSHVAWAFAAAIETARTSGLEAPVVYNSGGYDRVETLRVLEGYVDIYMPDMKFADNAVAERFARAGDYWEVATAAVKEMHRQVGDLEIGDDGVARRGLLVRHLVLPNGLAGSKGVIDFLAEEVSGDTAVNVMDQYRPCFKATEHEDMNRRCTREEYEEARGYAAKRVTVLVR